MSPLHLVVVIAAVAAAFAWLASLATGDTSWIDRLWSVLPETYVWVFALRAGLSDTRLDVMAILTTAWGLRLTFNFARRGGYTGTEDYRWAVLRSSMRRWQFQLFNLFFIVVYQSFLLVLIALPAFTAYQHRGAAFGPLDAFLTTLFVAMLVGETVADQQQWNFQRRKRIVTLAGDEPTTRFLQAGLFRYARHPNYFFEIAQWWIVFLFGAVAARSLAQWTLIGPVLLSALFVGSTSFTEKISRSRYPEYEHYQRTTSAIVPWFSRARSIVTADESAQLPPWS